MGQRAGQRHRGGKGEREKGRGKGQRAGQRAREGRETIRRLRNKERDAGQEREAAKDRRAMASRLEGPGCRREAQREREKAQPAEQGIEDRLQDGEKR